MHPNDYFKYNAQHEISHVQVDHPKLAAIDFVLPNASQQREWV